MRFQDMVQQAAQRNQSLLCVGLDPDPQRIPAQFARERAPLYAFCMAIMEATADLVCAFKPNSAFFEALGAPGFEILQRLAEDAPPDVPLILDAKRGDIGSTAEAYARAAFEQLGYHAVTLNPYLGGDALAPFLRYADRGCIVLCKTSNAGSADFQDLVLATGEPLYMEVARRARDQWNANKNVGLVVGATHPQQLRAIRERCPELLLLLPGIGAQGGDLAAAVAAAVDIAGAGIILSASRSVLYAANGGDALPAARREAMHLRAAINAARGA
ncbi:MAG: orotidine-5'-phosphate decarboxylase [Roseiflexaceae bacterium]|nr:orotidine-5'-phosphate decarboxylase [Roseiflexaceae bacterium]